MAGSNGASNTASSAPANTTSTEVPHSGVASRELRARGRRTMTKLLEAGATVFAARGYHAARVDDIVKMARTSHGTFYLYFANKEELFRALAADVAASMSELAEALPELTADGDGFRSLHEWLGTFTDLYLRCGPVIRAWTEAEIGGSEFGRLGTDVLAEFARIFARRIREVAPSDVDPQVAALALVAMIERASYYVLARQIDVEPDAMLATLATVTHRALFAAAAHRG